MTHFIFGRAGSGKSERIYSLAAKNLRAGRHTFLLVPEQQAVAAEQRMADILTTGDAGSESADSPELGLEILNFKRLCNRVFREYGGISYNYISDSGRALLMWQALTELSGDLTEYGGKVDKSRVELMLSAVSELKAYRITPSALERSLERLNDSGEAPALAAKLSDLSLIFADYVSLVALTNDDAADDLTKAAEAVDEHGFFKGSDVFLDSFNGFTPQEFELIRLAAKQADSLTISLTLGEGSPFENLADTAAKLKRLAGEYTEEFLTENLRHSAPELRALEAGLWENSAVYTGSVDSIRLIECPNLFAECEAVAADICRRVRNGASYRDFAITLRGVERYDGIIDVILEKYGVPFFFSKRTDLTEKPLIRLILSAYAILTGGFRTTDVVTYIKTGLTGLTADEAEALTRYAELWKLRGNRWREEFTLDPRGYTTEPIDDSVREKLSELNSIRKKLISPLESFFGAIGEGQNVREQSAALYKFLLSLDIPTQLELRAGEAEPDEAAELTQLWSVLVDSLDELVAAVSELKADAEIFTKLLGIVFSGADIGRIPAAVDVVTVGDASLLRANAKHIYVIGANEGIFPAAPDSGGIFTDSDRETLARLGIELAGGGEYRVRDERFTFYRALTSASKSLTVSWASADLSGKTMRRSFGATRLKKLFPELKVTIYDSLPVEDRLEGRPKLVEYAAETAGTRLGGSIARYLKEDARLADKLEKLTIPLTETDASLSPETAKLIAGKDLALTQSRLDSYVLCKFSYYCKYILKLEETKPADFDAADIGSFIHHILEVFVSSAGHELSDDEIDRMVDEIVDGYIKKIAEKSGDDRRLAHLFTKLRRSSRLLCRNIAEEFNQSGFRPSFYELPIRFPAPGENAGEALPSVDPLEVDLGDGTHAYIYGIADRVDTYRRAGKLYVRVIDYKTGSKDFSMEDIALGLNLQMLLYLFSLWKNGSRPDSALSGLAGSDEIVPAGVLYFSANIPTVSADTELSPSEVERRVSDKLARRGLLLDDREVLTAMEQELGGHYLPVKVKKDGSFTRSDALKTLEDFGSLLHSIEDTIHRIGGELKRGNISARPMKNRDHNACRFCPMKPVCRSAGTAGEIT